MVFSKIINHMKQKGVRFSPGLTNHTIKITEEIYEIRFPNYLKVFYETVLPISIDNEEYPLFPRWDDLSPKNIDFIRQLMNAPYRWLRKDIEKGFSLQIW